MKKVSCLFVMFMLFITNVFSQVTLTQEQIDALPEDAKKAIQTVSTVEKVSNYASWGHEIGIAVDEALGAVEEHVVNLSETELGKKVTFLVVWKFLYKDIIEIVIGVILLVLSIVILFKIIKLPHKESFQRLDVDSQTGVFFLYGITLVILFSASMMVLFI